MDALAATIGAACTQAMKGLQDELHDQKVSHHAAIELFQNRLGELRRLLTEQGRRTTALEQENAMLKQAQQAHQAQADAGQGDDAHEQIEELQRVHDRTRQTLLDQVAAMQAAQNRQQSMIEALKKHRTAEQTRSGEALASKAHDELTLRQNHLAHQLNSVEAEYAGLIHTQHNQAALLKGLQTAFTAHQQQSHQNTIVPLQRSLAELQRAQKDQARTIESVVVNQAAGSQQPIVPLPTQHAELRRDLDQLDHYRSDHATRLATLEGFKAALVKSQTEGLAHLRRHDGALASLERSASQIHGTLRRTERKAEDLREELLSITRTLLGFINAVKPLSRANGSGGASGSAQAGDVAQLQQQAEAVLMPRTPHVGSSPAKDTTLSDRGNEPEPVQAKDKDEPTLAHEDIQEPVEVPPVNGNRGGLHDPFAAKPFASLAEEEGTVDAPTKRKKLPSRDGYCHDCGRIECSIWRGGPNGRRTLCNTCGTRYSRTRKQKQAMSPVEKPAMAAPVPATTRESSASSTSTFGTYEHKEQSLRELSERALRRKPALSPLKERFEQPQDAAADQTTMSSKSMHGDSPSMPKSSTVKLTRTGYNLAETSDSGTGVSAVRPLTSPGRDPNKQHDPTLTASIASKRKRLNADEKARLMANQFVADSEFGKGRKRRRTAAAKTVRFDFGDNTVEVDEDDQGGGKDGVAASDLPSIDSLQPATASSPSNAQKEQTSRSSADDSAPALGGQATSAVQSKVQDRGQRAVHNTTLVDGKDDVKGKLRTKTSEKFKSKGASIVEEDTDGSDDNIVVSRPDRPTLQNTEPASPPAERAEPKKRSSAPADMLGSEDELALPSPPHPNPGATNNNLRSSYTAGSVRGEPESKAAGRETYQNLLSQFKLSKEGQKKEQAAASSTTAPAGEEVEARPKRQPKPRKFGDVVDVRTLTEKQLGE